MPEYLTVVFIQMPPLNSAQAKALTLTTMASSKGFRDTYILKDIFFPTEECI